MDLVARAGGDDFLILLTDLERGPRPGADAATEMAEGVAARLHGAMTDPFEVKGTELFITASMGIALFPQDGEDAAALLSSAETAMRHSQRSGPGGWVVHAAGGDDAMARLSLSTRLRRATENRSWVLHYQPIVDLATAEMIGVESLIRWREPDGQMIPPNDFIPLAEDMGLIEAIGAWVVEEMCRQDTEWRSEGLELEIAFNLSPRQLWKPELADTILDELIAAGIEPQRVVVEITESAAMTDLDRTKTFLHAIHDRGIRLALDDFGTGYSSLARLKHLPLDILKIDRSFVQDVDRDPESGSIVSAIVALAKGLGMTPLAEGIETLEEWRFLVEQGCALGQGFYFSRPVPAEDILALHRERSTRLAEVI